MEPSKNKYITHTHGKLIECERRQILALQEFENFDLKVGSRDECAVVYGAFSRLIVACEFLRDPFASHG